MKGMTMQRTTPRGLSLPSRGLRQVTRRSLVTRAQAGKMPPKVAAAVVAAPGGETQRGGVQWPVDNNGDLTETGEWRRNFDLKAWGSEIKALEKELRAEMSVEDDVAHLKKMITWTNVCWVAGVALAPFSILPAAFLMSQAIVARWTMIGHHVCHGGYNTLQQTDGKITGRFHRRTFAKGIQRRMTDWLDWMKPEAWDVEHNNLHHYELGELGDPDLVERNVEQVIRAQKKVGVPYMLRLAQVVPLFAVWKWYYYAPNTLKELEKWETRKAEKSNGKVKAPTQAWSHLGQNAASMLEVAKGLFTGNFRMAYDLGKCLLPYGIMMFGVIPAGVYALLGAQAAHTALCSVVLAEVLTNVHSFVIIATNHAGNDIYRFNTPVLPKTDEFYLRAVIGSTNFHTGSDFGKPGSLKSNLVDYPQGWLNYQIEHHMWPDMSMLAYQKGAPRVKAICKKHGVPYVQQPVWNRVKKTVDIMTGDADMLVWEKGQ